MKGPLHSRSSLQPALTVGLDDNIALRLINIVQRYSHDVDGVADYVGRAFLSLGSLGFRATIPQ